MKKQVNIKKVWAVFTDHDESGSHDEVDDLRGVYEDKAVAEKNARGIGWFGGDGPIEERTAIRCDGKWFLTQNPVPVKLNRKHLDKREDLKKSALKKLTKDERIALGLECVEDEPQGCRRHPLVLAPDKGESWIGGRYVGR